MNTKAMLSMLWFDDSKKSLEQKVQQAAAYFTEKYGCEYGRPVKVQVHPSHVGGESEEGGEMKIDGIVIEPSPHLAYPSYFYVVPGVQK